MIDVHCHLLPNVDDGPKSWDAAVDLCRALSADGITTAVTTPHVIDHVYGNTTARVAALVAELRERLGEAGIPLEVLPGGEVEVSCRHLTERPHDDIPTLAGGRYLLVELPTTLVPHSLESLLFSLASRGVTPVIAHPERCFPVQRDLEVARRWTSAGAVLQVDAESVLGLFDAGAQRAARGLIQAGLVHVMASDSHSCRRRPPRLRAAADAVADLAGRTVADFLVEEGPGRVVRGEPAGDPPSPARRERGGLLSRWFGRH